MEYGWIMSSNNMYKPVFTLDAIAPESVLKISKCKCETGCRVKYNRCSCVKGGYHVMYYVSALKLAKIQIY